MFRLSRLAVLLAGLCFAFAVAAQDNDTPVDPPGQGPLLKWQVSNENNMYGYLIYRGDGENGPFLRVNKDIVRVGDNKGDGVTSTYAWRDDSATAGKTYWYYIGMLNRDGTKQQLSGPQQVKAK